MGLRDIGATLPPGFRFYPSDEELVRHYLYKKIANGKVSKDTLVEIDLHTCEPWQLPDVAKLNANEWYFFSFRDRKYATGFRTNRATASGYWKATGKDRTVRDPRTRSMVGMRKTLVFYRNRAPNGIKTGWIMHEFRLENAHVPPKEDWVLCRVSHKTKPDSGDSSNDIYDSITGGGGGGSGGGGGLSPTPGESPPFDHAVDRAGYSQVSPSFPHNPPHQSHKINPGSFPNMLASLDRNHLPLSHQDHNQMVQYKCEDECRFLFDVNFGESTLRAAGVSSCLEDVQFHDDDHGSSFVFT